MPRNFRTLAHLALLAYLFTLPTLAVAQQPSRVFADEYVILKHESAAPLLQATSYQPIAKNSFSSLVRLKTKANTLQAAEPTRQTVEYRPEVANAACAKIMAEDPNVRICEPNFEMQLYDTFPNDPLFYPYQFHHYSDFGNGTTIFDLRSHKAWDVTRGSQQIVVGIVDSGINYLHPDLSPNLWVNPKETPNNNVDDDGNGYVDDMIGINAFLKNNDPLDCNGHGSHVAGIIGAKGNNNVGVTGVNWDVSMVAARTSPDCGPSISVDAVITGLDYFYKLKQSGVNLVAVNGSYGGTNQSAIEKEAIARLGRVNVVFVAAAGNDGINIDTNPRWPAAHDLDTMLSIANVDTFSIPNVINDSSNFGVKNVDFGAPGTQILSTVYPGDPGADFGGGNETYGTKTGTSMAAPAVTGAIALAIAKYPQLNTTRAVISHMLGTTFTVGFLQGRTKVPGILTLFNVVTMPLPQDLCPSDPNKLEAGTCGCGVTDTYTDSDADGFPNCMDSCPADANKSTPGTCGCGVSDADSDADGTVNCQDLCMNDPAKSSPGSCGCGVSDADSNANGVVDCVDAGISAETPKQPKVTLKKGKLQIQMTERTGGGVQYKITITTKISKKKTKVVTKIVNSAKATIALPKGLSTSITYSWVIPGAGEFTSADSKAKKINL